MGSYSWLCSLRSLRYFYQILLNLNKEKKVYIIAGEASGDLHASNMMEALLSLDSNINFRFWGGDRMIAVQNSCVKHIRDLAFMGFIEVVMNIRTIARNIRFCKKDILEYKPDVLLLVDYPGFNLRIAKWAKTQGIEVAYYISPQVWAWKQKRVHTIKEVVDHMYVILPFEKDFYKKFNMDVDYVGHPLLDEVSKFQYQGEDSFREKHQLDERPIIAILPGSRKQEISRKLPIMLESAKGIDSHQLVIAGAPNMELSDYSDYDLSNAQIIKNDTYQLLANSDVAVVTSGTATLETALFKVPQVVCYKGSSISYHIAKRLVKVKYISLVNLIMGEEVVKELIQSECNAKTIRFELERLLNDETYVGNMRSKFEELNSILGGGGASKNVASALHKVLER